MEVRDQTTFVQIVGQVLIADGVLEDGERAQLDQVIDEVGREGDDRREALSGIDLDSNVANASRLSRRVRAASSSSPLSVLPTQMANQTFVRRSS